MTTARDQALGVVDFIRFPARGSAWGGPFNGQPARQALFRQLINRLGPAAIIETGTFLGTTTAFMAETGLPVFTVEGDPRNFGFAKARLWRQRQVTIRHGDSREVLPLLFDGPLRPLREQILFAYLDAHWDADLPLAEELEIVLSRCPAAIVMIDDFQVPFDPGYEYDDYGVGKALTPAYIAPAVAAHELEVFYPSTPSCEEGGARRGCVVLAKLDAHGGELASMSLLRR